MSNNRIRGRRADVIIADDPYAMDPLDVQWVGFCVCCGLVHLLARTPRDTESHSLYEDRMLGFTERRYRPLRRPLPYVHDLNCKEAQPRYTGWQRTSDICTGALVELPQQDVLISAATLGGIAAITELPDVRDYGRRNRAAYCDECRIEYKEELVSHFSSNPSPLVTRKNRRRTGHELW